MLTPQEYQDDSSTAANVPPSQRERVLEWMMDVLTHAEQGDKSGAGPFIADKFPLQDLELAKQVCAVLFGHQSY